MILTALMDYYMRLEQDEKSGISLPGNSLEKISYVLVIDCDGEVVTVDDIREANGKRHVPKGIVVPKGEKRTSAVKSNFLWDKTNYVLGLSSDEINLARLDELKAKTNLGKDEENEIKKLDKAKSEFERGVARLPTEHAAFKKLHELMLNNTQDIGLNALLNFLSKWLPQKFIESPVFSSLGKDFLDSNVIFRLEGERQYLHQRPAAKAVLSSLSNQNEEKSLGWCLVTGEYLPLARLHPSIKGVKDSQSSGADIVSFNRDAFTSYGKKQGNNAPVSEQAAFAYTTALNHLLRMDNRNRQRIQIGDATVVFWAQAENNEQAEAAEDFFAGFFQPKDIDAQETASLGQTLEKIAKGLPLSELNPNLKADTRIFVVGLAPNASRLSIRFWETESLKTLTERLVWHYRDMELEPLAWKRPPSIGFLVAVTGPYRKKDSKYDDKAVSPSLAGELARSVLTGVRYPQNLLNNLIMRMRADGEISDIRVALCKGVLTRAARLDKQHGRSSNNKGEIPVSLDTSNTDPGYLLGRLFYLFGNAQKQAIGEVNANVKDKFFGSASATPALVFPMLLRNLQNHLSRLRKGGEKEKQIAGAIDREVGDIINSIGTSFPKSLGLEAQGQFAIGYYHQSKAHHTGNNTQKNTDKTTESEGEKA